MAIGDPHIKSYKLNDEYQTCNGLEYFPDPQTESQSGSQSLADPSVASEMILLLSNEWFSLAGQLKRWSGEVNGTYFSQMILSVIESTATRTTDDSYITYTYDPRNNNPPAFARKTVSMVIDESTGIEREQLTMENITDDMISVS